MIKKAKERGTYRTKRTIGKTKEKAGRKKAGRNKERNRRKNKRQIKHEKDGIPDWIQNQIAFGFK